MTGGLGVPPDWLGETLLGETALSLLAACASHICCPASAWFHPSRHSTKLRSLSPRHPQCIATSLPPPSSSAAGSSCWGRGVGDLAGSEACRRGGGHLWQRRRPAGKRGWRGARFDPAPWTGAGEKTRERDKEGEYGETERGKRRWRPPSTSPTHEPSMALGFSAVGSRRLETLSSAVAPPSPLFSWCSGRRPQRVGDGGRSWCTSSHPTSSVSSRPPSVQEEIYRTLKDYNSQIEQLKQEMDNAMCGADNIKSYMVRFPYAHRWQCGKRGTVLEILLALRFFIYQYGLVNHLNITKQHNQSVLVYGFSWVVILVMLLIMKVGTACPSRLLNKVLCFFILVWSAFVPESECLQLQVGTACGESSFGAWFGLFF